MQIGVKLVKLPNRVIVAQQIFDAAVPAAANLVPAIIDAFDTALHQVIRRMVDWVLATAR